MDVEHNAAEVQRLINAYSDAAMDHALKAKQESDLEADRTAVKSAAIRRIMAGPNERNPEKPHSVSSAEAVVESDPEYRAYLATQSETVFSKNMAWAAMESFKMRVMLALAVIDATVGV